MVMLIVLLGLVGYGGGEEAARIINGSPVLTDGSFPRVTWQVALEVVRATGFSLCGGTIVDATHVITAAHCLRDDSNDQYENPAAIRVITGISRASKTGRNVYSVRALWVEPSYSSRTPSFQNRIDLGIVEVAEPFVFDANVQPVPMCSGSNCFPAGQPLIVSGYGQTVASSSSSSSNNLLYATLTAVAQPTCEARFNSNFNCASCFPITSVCAQSDPLTVSPQKDSCFGDSGGPLVRYDSVATPNFQLVGVVSTGTVPVGGGTPCGQAGQYGVYVAVAPNMLFINSVLSGQRNGSAITSSCVTAGTCGATGGSTTPGGTGPLLVSTYYIVAAIIAGIVCLMLLFSFVLKSCRARHYRRNRISHDSHFVAAEPVVQPAVVTMYPAPVAPSAPPVYPAYPAPEYSAPVFQTPPTHQQQPSHNPAELLPGQYYAASPQEYGAGFPPQAPPPAPYGNPYSASANNPYGGSTL